MNFSIFCPVDSRGLDVVETAGFRRNSSNLGTLWVSRIKVIGTALNKRNLPDIVFAKSAWTLIGCPGFNFVFEN